MANKTKHRELSRSKRLLFSVILVLLSIVTALVIAEFTARLLKPEKPKSERLENRYHSKLGWLPKQSVVIERTHEYTAHFHVNSFGMNDMDIDTTNLPEKRILGVGDSHTFAVGIDHQLTWPNVLEQLLFDSQIDSGQVYNGGMIGYSLGQYLVRARLLEPIIDPDLIIIGFSMATDLYDLIPPGRGGFIYGGGKGRIYFDLDSDSNLVEKHDLVGGYVYSSQKQMEADQADTGNVNKSRPKNYATAQKAFSSRLRDFLSKFELYNLLRRSKAAMWVATNLRPGGQSLWPGLDTSLKIKLTEEDAYRWKLADEILKQFQREAMQWDAQLVLVNIPYLAQVYDDVWESSFGSNTELYNRWIGNHRLQRICKQIGITYIDTTPDFIRAHEATGKWLHYRDDGHPTKEGQRIIAKTVYQQLRDKGLLDSL
mgnify:CR=1 FL=1